MHAVFALEQSGERCVWEVVLHLEQMDQFRHSTTLVDYLLQVVVWIGDELVNGVLVSEDTIFLIVFENTKIRLSRHQETLFHDIDEAESQEVERYMHEIWSAIRHQPDNLVPNDLRIKCLGNVLLDESLIIGLFHVQVLAFSDKLLW